MKNRASISVHPATHDPDFTLGRDPSVFDCAEEPERSPHKVRVTAAFDVDVSPPEIAERLLDARKAARLTQKELAARSGVGYRTISTLEANTEGRAESIPLDVLIALCDALDVDLGEMLAEDGVGAVFVEPRPVRAVRA